MAVLICGPHVFLAASHREYQMKSSALPFHAMSSGDLTPQIDGVVVLFAASSTISPYGAAHLGVPPIASVLGDQ
ncbi:hypothetical protein [Amycolatopsis sp. Hca4]|uniref:hypothetical protein n=1 Tax=Amycolatopsis sp. Hca4 TaxID=2742131 RepID=UPI001591E828|nr:hypothetical protein [Amycolatopsis sp. Hca4]QKV80400.1 hypothetical protein HUT10_46430 [Amycolatopsis sp. Hca4]